ncbi:MAG: LytTR family transcriptional regulator [Mucilaginibacter sp.]|nr:LytTR family transcriptional regulator [Mucilaginibacter sp.]
MKWPILKRLLYLGFWIIITLIFLYDRLYLIQKAGLGHFTECTVVRLALIISLAYLHLYYLIPRYFSNKEYLKYFTFLVLSLGLYVSLQSLYDIYLYGFVIGAVSYRDFWYSFPFNFITTAWYLLLTVAFKLSVDWYEQRNEVLKLQEELSRVPAFVNTEKDGEYLFLKSGTKKLKTPIASVTYIQGLKDYSVVYTDEGKIIIKGTLKSVEELFPEKHFTRIHKSYMVTNSKIKLLESNKVVLTNGTSVPIGRSYKHLLDFS